MQKGFFLRIEEGPHVFLMARDETLAVEPRRLLQIEDEPAGSGIQAWFSSDGRRWPVFRLADLLGFDAGEWGDAVMLDNNGSAVGVAAERIQQLAEPYAVEVRPFTPIGCILGSSPIYGGVCAEGTESTLVFDANGLTRLVESAIDL